MSATENSLGIEIGKGAYSTIYKIVNDSFAKKIVVKVPKTHNTRIEGLEESSIIEADILLRAAHPNILSAIDIIDLQDGFNIIMEEADMNLMRWIDKNNRPEDYLQRLADPPKVYINIIFQMSSGLHYLHNSNVIHQDLKPENILLFNTSSPESIVAKICDFGISTITIDYVNSPADVQSQGYRAPEILLNKPYTNKIDIWSLGIICYELITSQKPVPFNFDGQTYINKFRDPEVMRLAFNFMEVGCRDVILKMIEPDPDLRSSAEGLLDSEVFFDFCEKYPWNLSDHLKIKKAAILPLGIYLYPHVRKQVLLYSYDVNFLVNDFTINGFIPEMTIKFYDTQAWFLSVNILDRYCSTINLFDLDTLKVCAIASLFVSSKIYYFFHKRLEEFIIHVREPHWTIDRGTLIDRILKFEREIFKNLNYTLFRPPLTSIFPLASKQELKNYLINSYTSDEIYD